mmetsp:Transcript_5171/g.10932  ORF Transcript_5171/g.10932 Transcript_5171/m.10932 type:complete len:109 (+) Transcript_5171:166-492(+)
MCHFNHPEMDSLRLCSSSRMKSDGTDSATHSPAAMTEKRPVAREEDAAYLPEGIPPQHSLAAETGARELLVLRFDCSDRIPAYVAINQSTRGNVPQVHGSVGCYQSTY